MNLSRRQARWSEFLQRFNFVWEYRPGRTNVADPLSRNPCRSVLPTALFGLRRLEPSKGAADPIDESQVRSAQVSSVPLRETTPISLDSDFSQLSKEIRRGYANDPGSGQSQT